MYSKAIVALCVIGICVLIEVNARPPKKYPTSFATFSAEIVKGPRKGHVTKIHSYEDDDDDEASFETSHEFLKHQANFYDDKLHSEENYFPYRKTKPKPKPKSKYYSQRGKPNTVKKKPDDSMHYLTKDGDDIHAHHHFFHEDSEENEEDDDDDDDDKDDEDDDDDEDDEENKFGKKKNKHNLEQSLLNSFGYINGSAQPNQKNRTKPFTFEYDNSVINGYKPPPQSQKFKEIDDLINKAQNDFFSTKNKYNFEIDLKSHTITSLNTTPKNNITSKPKPDFHSNIFNSFPSFSLSDPYFYQKKNISHSSVTKPSSESPLKITKKPFANNEHLNEYKDFFGVKHKLKPEEPRPSAHPLKGHKGSLFGIGSKDPFYISSKNKLKYEGTTKKTLLQTNTKTKFGHEDPHHRPTTYRPKHGHGSPGPVHVSPKPVNAQKNHKSSPPTTKSPKVSGVNVTNVQGIASANVTANATANVTANGTIPGGKPANVKPTKVPTKHKHPKQAPPKQLYYKGVPVKNPRQKSRRKHKHHRHHKPSNGKHTGHKHHHPRKPPKPKQQPAKPIIAEEPVQDMVPDETTLSETYHEEETVSEEVIQVTERPWSVSPIYSEISHSTPKRKTTNSATTTKEVLHKTTNPKKTTGNIQDRQTTSLPKLYVTPSWEISSTSKRSDKPKHHQQTHKPHVTIELPHSEIPKPHQQTHRPHVPFEQPQVTEDFDSPEDFDEDDELSEEMYQQYVPTEYYTNHPPKMTKPTKPKKPESNHKTTSKPASYKPKSYPPKTTSKPKFHFEKSKNRVTPQPESSEEVDLNEQLFHYEPFSPPSIDGQEHTSPKQMGDGQPQRKRKCRRKKQRQQMVIPEEHYDTSDELHYGINRNDEDYNHWQGNEHVHYAQDKHTNYDDYRYVPEVYESPIFNEIDYDPQFAQRREDTAEPQKKSRNKDNLTLPPNGVNLEQNAQMQDVLVQMPHNNVQYNLDNRLNIIQTDNPS